MGRSDVVTSVGPDGTAGVLGGRWRWLQRVVGSAALRAIGIMAGATGIGQVAILLTLPVITRLYDPTAFGRHGLIMSFVGMASVAVCLCLDLAIVQARTSDEADELCVAALLSVVVTGTLSILVLGALVLGSVLGYGQLPWWSALWGGVMVALNGVYVAARYRQLRDQHYVMLARATVTQNGGRAVAPLGWALLFRSWLGLTLGELTGRLLGVWPLLAPLLPRLKQQPAWGSFAAWWRIVRREHRYTVILLSTVLIDATASLLIVPLLAGAYGTDTAGEYFLVSNVLVAPSALIGRAAADVIHTRGASLYINAPRAVPGFLRRAALFLFVAGAAMYLPVYALAPYVFPTIFGQRWTLLAPIAQALTPFMIVGFVATPCARLLTAVGRQELKLWSDLLRLIGTPLLVYVCVVYRIGFQQTIVWLSWFLAVAYALYFLITVYGVASQARRAHAHG